MDTTVTMDTRATIDTRVNFSFITEILRVATHI